MNYVIVHIALLIYQQFLTWICKVTAHHFTVTKKSLRNLLSYIN